MESAIIIGDYKKVEELLKDGHDVNYVLANHDSLLMRAILRKHVKIVELLLSKGANPNYENKSNYIPLKRATYITADLDMVRLLLERVQDQITEVLQMKMYHLIKL
jgi:ankyrin repeat protein